MERFDRSMSLEEDHGEEVPFLWEGDMVGDILSALETAMELQEAE